MRLRRTARQALALSALAAALAGTEAGAGDAGRAVYDFYCYQCHGYAGDARTLASRFLHPPPRDFTAADPRALDRERMIDAVTRGRTGTAMVGFASVIGEQEIAAVVDYVRAEYMAGRPSARRYHTPENGWPDHGRYAEAYPFATGEVPIDTPWEDLTGAQRRGRRLFLHACATCHHTGAATDEGPVWEPRALSYPRRHYSHRLAPDAISGASPYALHDRPPAVTGLAPNERRGERLFQDNCAFCHAADGTARNWIGSFLEPRPRDLTDAALLARSRETLTAVILDGLPGTSMPAWRGLLSEPEVADLVAYMRRAFGGGTATGAAASHATGERPAPPAWRRAAGP